MQELEEGDFFPTQWILPVGGSVRYRSR